MEPKLVRDRIPDIIEQSGKSAVVRYIEDDAEYEAALLAKLTEESAELASADGDARCEEIADVLEVLLAIAEHHGLRWEQVQARCDLKRNERGGFAGRRLLIETR